MLNLIDQMSKLAALSKILHNVVKQSIISHKVAPHDVAYGVRTQTYIRFSRK